VTLVVVGGILCLVKKCPELRTINVAARHIPLRFSWLVLHCVSVAVLALLAHSLFSAGDTTVGLALKVGATLIVALTSGLALLAATAPLTVWRAAAVALGRIWIYAILAASAATLAIAGSQSGWAQTAHLTFLLVQWLLSPWMTSLHGDPVANIVYTGRFAVQINEACSGLEGLGLMGAFCVAWLLFLRRELEFPRAFVLIPLGLVLIFGLNVLRIAALVAIGHLGYPGVALAGFHSQAGWIAFNGAACAIAFATHRTRWLARVEECPPTVIATDLDTSNTENRTARYLLPLLAILGAGMLSRAASDGFEPLQGIRLLAGAATLAVCWRCVSTLDWRWSQRGVLTGILVFAVWIVACAFLMSPASEPASLLALSPWARVLWILGRMATAVLVVPVAEELAYRGYLMRRLLSKDFEAIEFRDVKPWALAVSSVAFGLAHGALWMPGIVAGVVYGLLTVRTNSFSEGIVAHVTTNGLLAVGVLCFNHWEYW